MALHASLSPSGGRPVCGQLGGTCTIPLAAFARKLEEYRYRSVMCCKCKAWLRRGATSRIK